MSGTHKTLSPSSAARRRLCPGSLAACKGEPNPNTIYAAEGSAYHLLASTVLECHAMDVDGQGIDAGAGGFHCEDYVGDIIHVPYGDGEAAFGENDKAQFSFKINEIDAAYAQVFVDAMLRRKTANCRQLYEVKLDTSGVVGVPGQGGTGDCITLDFDTWTIYSDDLKFGKGKQVFASYVCEKTKRKRPNDQCAWYAAAALRMFRCLGPWQRVVMGIHQPRLPGGFVDEFEMSVEDLEAWVAEMAPIEQKAHRLWESGTEAEIYENLHPSKEACTFCPLDRRCKPQLDAAKKAFPVIQMPDGPNQARRQMWKSTDAEFLEILNIADEYSSFFAEVHSEGLRRLLAGSNLPGWKTVMGNRGRRKLNPDAKLLSYGDRTAKEVIDEVVGEDAYEPAELKSAAELDKTLNKKRHPDYEKRNQLWQCLASAITQADGQPQLVREGDARPAASLRNTAQEFGLIPPQ